MFRFASPWFFFAVLPAILACWWMGRRMRSGGARMPLPRAEEFARLAVSPWARLDRLRPWARGLCLLLVVVALARPQWGRREESVSSFGVDIVVALDISGSMRCEDFQPLNRLQVARRNVAAFVAGRPVDRLGLVVFAGSAATRCPLTLDHTMLERFVDEVDFAPPGDEGTAIGMGLATAVNRLRQSSAKSKVVVLVTDGRNNRGQIGPEAAAEAAAALGIRVYTIGVGTEGEAPCPIASGPLGKSYRMMQEDLDEPLLRRIAESTRGRYFRATDPKGLEEVFRTIDELEKTEVKSRVRVLYAERFHLALAPAGLLLALDLLLAVTRLRRIP